VANGAMSNTEHVEVEKVQVRLPLRALMDHLKIVEVTKFAEAVGLSRKSCYRYFEAGVPLFVADRLAIKVGLHPLEVWPEFHRDLEEAA